MDVCRTCMSDKGNFQPLFSERDLPSKIRLLTNINITDEVGLPSIICQQCIEQLEAFHKFHRAIHHTDMLLRCRKIETVEVAIKSELSNLEETRLKCNYNVQDPNTDNPSLKLEDKYDEQSAEEVSKDELLNGSSSSSEREPEDDFKSFKKEVKKRGSLLRCEKCSYATYKKNFFDNHVCSDQQARIICEICGRSIAHYNLPAHLSTHSTDNKSSCYVCGKVFKNYGSMRCHMYMHVPQQSVCELCGKEFQFKGEYRRHLRNHRARVKDRACEICGKLFYSPSEFRRHMNSHDGIRPFPCEYCGKKLSTRYALNTHRRQHTNEKPFACEICGMAFPQRVSLRTHMKSKHKEELKKDENTELL